MDQINASELKAQCLAPLDELGPDGVLLTKHGKPCGPTASRS